MKIYVYIIFILSWALIGCQKGEVPANNQKYIGTWKYEKNSNTNSYILNIYGDGKADYQEYSTNGASYKTVTVKGYIYFDNFEFRIGSKLFKKKFSIDSPPTRVTISAKPYKYYSIATFNGINYRKED